MTTGKQGKKHWVEAQMVSSATYDGGISFNMIYKDAKRRDHARGFIIIAEEVLGLGNAKELCDIYHLSSDTEDNEALKNICLFESDIGFFAAALSMVQGRSTPTYLQLFDLGNPFKGPLTETYPGGSFATHTFDIVTLLGGVHEDGLPESYQSIIKNWRDSVLDFAVDGKAPCTIFNDQNRPALMVNEHGVREITGAEYLDHDDGRRRRLLRLADVVAGNAGRDKLWVEVCRRWLMYGK
ncbi:hypothetical protein K491DRAFT_615584 [Lophiostoma macrostomum CBS 122681]|uniref:Carboxylesterase type B domain-containing protein n=1 Tax=Lophiostoma macrostomum CBS 122681 TaxID=1314788 RepID=A0A6A6SJ28_9PLEO|nr:hypothetical protein K491DRAFT_615584 [Lophiostoma macrostomum CBS 122681]